MTTLVDTNVMTSCPIVIHLILFILLRKSLRYNSEPAAKAIMANAIWFKKFNFLIASGVIKFNTEEPAMIPVIIKPVISGNLIFWNTWAIWLAAMATTKNPTR